MPSRLLALVAILAAAVLAACSQGNSGDETVNAATASLPTSIERFLLFPNPVQSGGSFETNTTAYAQAYYRAVDPNDDRDTLAKFKTVNQFDSGTGSQHTVVFRDVKDLGYGRRMTGRRNTDGSIAFIVENYNVSAVPGNYSAINVDAAVARDQRWHIGVNAIEYSSTACDSSKDVSFCADGASKKFAKFYNFDPVTGARQVAVDLDGKGLKAMPGPCISCHGGRADALTPADGTGNPRFPYVGNTATKKRGDTAGRLQPFRVDTFGFASTPGWTRTDQEDWLKDFNKWVLCTYPLVGAAAGAEDACRQTVDANEWQAPAADFIKAVYGGNGMPNATYSDTYVPTGWAGFETLYNGVVAPYCRTCHLVRGAAPQSDIDFDTQLKFRGYAERIRKHVFDRGNMPLAFLVYQDFWNDASAPQLLADYIDSVLGAQTATDSGGKPLRPGRAIADAGPDRVVRAGANATLYGGNSLFASSYLWTIVSQPGGGDAALTNATSATATFHATVTGDYVVRLAVNGGTSGDKVQSVTITVDSSFQDPGTIGFDTVKALLRNVSHTAGQKCADCHVVSHTSALPPVFYDSAIDRDRSGGVTGTDDDWLYREVLSRINFTDITASPLLRKPSGHHHNGSAVIDTSTAAGLRNYSKLYHWILAGAPTGGSAVIADAGADSSPTVKFDGAQNLLALNGTGSVGATTYQWAVTSSPGGSSPVIGSPSSATTTLLVDKVGTYVVTLTINAATDNVSATRTITVSETAVNAAFTPANGTSQPVTFTAGAGTVTLARTNVGTDLPATCTWSIQSGGGSLSGTSCSGATLNVTTAEIATTIRVRLVVTGTNPANTDTDNNDITITNGNGASVAVIANSTTASLNFTNPSVPSTAGIPASTLSLSSAGSSSGGGVTYSWSITSQPAAATGSYVATLSSSSAANPTLTVHRIGAYDLELSVDNGSGAVVATKTITVGVPANRTFTNVKAVLTNPAECNSCHDLGSTAFVPVGGGQPSWTNVSDGSGNTLYQRVAARADLTNPAQSLLVDCPSNGCRTMGSGHTGFGGGDFSNYNLFLDWIIGGALNN